MPFSPIFERDLQAVKKTHQEAMLSGGAASDEFKKATIWHIENNFRYAVETINVVMPATVSATAPSISIINFKRSTDSDMIIEQMSMQMFNIDNFPVPPAAPLFFPGSPFPPSQDRNGILCTLERPDINRSKGDKISMEQVFGDGKQPAVLSESILWKKNDNLKLTLYNFCTVPIRVVVALEGYFTDYVLTYPKYTVENLRANFNTFIPTTPANAGAPIISPVYNWANMNFGDNITFVYNGSSEFDTIIYGLNCNFNLAEYLSIESMNISGTIPLQYTPQISECTPMWTGAVGLEERGFIGNICGDARFPHILTSPIVLRGVNDQLRITIQNRLNATPPADIITHFQMSALVLESYLAR